MRGILIYIIAFTQVVIDRLEMLPASQNTYGLKTINTIMLGTPASPRPRIQIFLYILIPNFPHLARQLLHRDLYLLNKIIHQFRILPAQPFHPRLSRPWTWKICQ